MIRAHLKFGAIRAAVRPDGRGAAAVTRGVRTPRRPLLSRPTCGAGLQRGLVPPSAAGTIGPVRLVHISLARARRRPYSARGLRGGTRESPWMLGMAARRFSWRGGAAPPLSRRSHAGAAPAAPYRYEVPILSEAGAAPRRADKEGPALLRGVPPLRARPGPQADARRPRPRRTPYSVHAPGDAVKGRGRACSGGSPPLYFGIVIPVLLRTLPLVVFIAR